MLERFNRHDSKFVRARREVYPHLVKEVPAAGAAGRGGVGWIGLNPDPCKAKLLAKQKVAGRALRPISAPHLGRAQSTVTLQRSAAAIDAGHGNVQQTEAASKREPRPSSVPSGGRYGRRSGRSQNISSHQHFIEQKLELPEAITSDIFKKPLQGDEPKHMNADSMREMLYLGVSYHGQGRRAYLRARAKIMPQDRSKAPLTTLSGLGWDYSRGKPSQRLQPVPTSAAACVVPI